MLDLRSDNAVSTADQTVELAQTSLETLNLIDALAKARLENEALQERVLFLVRQIEELRSLTRPVEFDYDKLADKVFQRVQASVPTPQLQQLDEIEDLLQILEKMKASSFYQHDEEGDSTTSQQQLSHEFEVADQLKAIREEIQRLSASSS